MTIIEDPYWWDTDELVMPTQLSYDEIKDIKCDLVIVGAGYTGLSASITAAKYGAKVIVIDAGIPGQGASTRNGGMLGSPHKISFVETVKKYGEETARELLLDGIKGYEYTRNLLIKEFKDAEFKSYGRLKLAWSKKDFLTLKNDVDEAKRLANYDVELIQPENLKHHIGSSVYYGGALFRDHGGVNPMKFHNALIRKAIGSGVQFLSNKKVNNIFNEGTKKKTLVDGLEILSEKVLIATNGYTTSNFKFLKRRIYPVPSFIIATEPLSPNIIDIIAPGGHMMVETRLRFCYFRLSPDRTRLLFGGRAALHLINSKKAAEILYNLMNYIFPILKGTKITHSWSGLTGFTFSKLPHVGSFEEMQFALGYSGNGVALSPYLGHKAALQALGKEEGLTAFSKSSFATKFYYSGNPWFLKPASISFRIKDVLENIKRTIN